MVSIQTHNANETRALGARLAEQLQAGDVVLLEGELGAGKSEFTRGIAQGLGITGYITSPSFTILQVYDSGRIPLFHFDWYRLSGVSELYEMAMDEYLYDEGISVVEWPDIAREAIPERHLRIRIDVSEENDRTFTLMPAGGFREVDRPKLEEQA